MFICIVPSPVYLQVGTMITGRASYAGLPDFMLYSEYQKTHESLSEFVGDNLIYAGTKFYKAYAIWNNILHEYTLAGSTVPTWDDGREFLFPISIKRYYSDCKTFLYVKSIEALMNILRRATCGGHPLVNMSLSEFFVKMIRNSTDSEFVDKVKAFQPTAWDYYLSYERPYEVFNILYELGHDCLSYGSNAAAYLYFNYASDINLLPEIFSYGKADDLVSVYGCSEHPAFPMEKMISSIDSGSNIFYNSVANDQITKNSNMFNLQYIDRGSPWYDKLNMDDLLESIYQQPSTDFNVEIVSNTKQVHESVLFNMAPLGNSWDCWDNVRIAMNQYNSQSPVTNQLVKININKTWLDELFISLAFANGEVINYFVSLALFHLYSPSIIRTPLAEVLNSSQK